MEHQPNMSEIVAALLVNEGGRYVLIGSVDEAREGRAMIFDKIARTWIRITSEDGADTLHRETVAKMLSSGASVERSAPRP